MCWKKKRRRLAFIGIGMKEFSRRKLRIRRDIVRMS
jgi:hypothetical protein